MKITISDLLEDLAKLWLDRVKEEASQRRRIVLEKHSDMGVFPGAKIGDLLYHCEDVAYGVATHVIVAKDGDHAMIVWADRTDEVQTAGWAASWHYDSPAKALQAAAAQDLDYGEPLVTRAKRVQAAIAAGEDLAEFIEGIGDD